jgi:pimeloyl-ACP methyl ester carboxylesterase
VLLHAWPLDARMWRGQLPALREHGEVHALDLPGFGNALPAGSAPTMDEWAEVLAEDLRSRGVERAAFAGCSMGGYASLALLRVRPEIVAAIALVNSRTTPDTPEQRAARAATIQRIEREGPAFVVEDSALMLGPTTRANRPDVVAAVRVIAGDATPEALIAGYRSIGSRPDSTELLASAGIPVAIIAGADDPLIPASSSNAAVAAVPRASLTVIESAGHISPMECSGAVTHALRAFWGQLDS